MSSLSSAALSLPESQKLKGAEDYSQWRNKVLNLAKSNALTMHLHTKARTHAPPEVDLWDRSITNEERDNWVRWEAEESQMKLAITLNCKPGPLAHTEGDKSALDMWEALQKQYEGSGTVLEYNAIQTYVTIKYDDFNSLEAYVVAFRLSITKLEALDSAPPSHWHPIMFIAGCSNRWPIWADRQRSNLRSAMAAGRKSEITLEALIEDITDEARASQSSKMNGTVLYGNKSASKPHSSDYKKSENKGGFKDSKKSTSRNNTSSPNSPCPHCKQPEPYHKAEDCFAINKSKREAWEKDSGKKYVFRHLKGKDDKSSPSSPKGKKPSRKIQKEDEESDNDLFGHTMPLLTPGPILTREPGPGVNSSPGPISTREPGPGVNSSTSCFSSKLRNRWLYDTGASEHVSNDLSKFTSYTAQDNLPSLSTVNGSVQPLGVGTCKVNALKSNGKVCVLELINTLYIPQSPVCLYSGGKLNKIKGFHRNGKLFLSNEKEICTVDNNMYINEEQPSTDSSGYVSGHALPAAIENGPLDIELWHRRLGHAGLQTVRKTQSAVTDMQIKETKSGKTRICAPCEKGRPLRHVNKRSARPRPTKALDELHVDVVHLKPTGLNGHKYASIFTCPATMARWGWTYTNKSDAFEANKKMISLSQTQYNRTIKRWRTDGGKEYSPTQMRILAENLGMILEESTPYTPEQDGRSERSIRTLMEKLRTAVIDQNIPSFLWPHLLLSVIHITNLTASDILGGKTPHEVFWDDIEPDKPHTPSVKHLRVLGCRVYVLIEKEKRTQSNKLAPRAEVGTLVGFDGRSIYQIYMPSRTGEKIIRSSHVRFDEDGLITEPYLEENSSSQLRGDLTPGPGPRVNSHSHDFTPGPGPRVNTDSHDDFTPGPGPRVNSDLGEANEAELPTPRKRGRPPGSKNKAHPQPSEKRATRSTHALGFKADNSNDKEAYLGAFHMALLDSPYPNDPKTVEQALSRADADKWRSAINSEYNSLAHKNTWVVVKRSELSKDDRVLGSRLVFKTKRDQNGEISRWKVRFVVQGYMQRQGRDYDQTFAGVCKSAVWKIAIALAALYDFELDQFDVETAFLNSEADSDIYVKLPPGYTQDKVVLSSQDHHCLKLLKALYGLKQSPRLWQEKLRSELQKLDFQPLDTDNCVYINRASRILIVTYVDDFLVVAKKGDIYDKFKRDLRNLFEITGGEPANYFLGVRIVRDRQNRTISLCQDAYVDKVLERFHMTNCKSVPTPFASGCKVHMVKFEGQATPQEVKLYQEICGSLQYLAHHTRWDILYHCSILSKFLTNPSPQHMAASKRVLQYLQGTRFYCTTFGSKTTDLELQKLHGYCDSDWAGDRGSRASHSGAVFFLNNGVISASSKRQTIVALSSTEAEYVAMCKFAQEASWIRQVLKEMGYAGDDATKVEMICDNQGALHLTENPEYHQRTKHIDIKFHYIRQELRKGHLDLWYTNTKDNAADGLTKSLNSSNHAAFIKLLNMKALHLD
ncbi:hypothetical protein PZA11_001233 [Diplocarpon coronariae]